MPWRHAILLLVAGCSTGGHSWYLKPAAEIGGGVTRDVALWTLLETEADLALECGDDALHIVLIGIEEHPPEPVTLRAGGAEFRGLLVVDPLDDGLGSSVIAVPLGDPLVDAIAGGARSLRFQWPEDEGRVPLRRIPARLVRDCRALEKGF